MGSNENMTSLQNELCVWRANRLLYPGWLIAPYQTRDKIWLRSRYWLDLAIEAGESWPPSQVVILWRELSWRLETCLQLIPDEAVNSLHRAVDSVERNDETGEFLFDVRSLRDMTGPNELKLPSQELREAWIECVLALLLSYRFRPDVVAFQGIAERLYALEYLSQNQRCQVLYQSCLVALAEMDREKATLLVDDWPQEPEDPYWLVRKAQVYLELGDQLTATAAAKEALEKIRRRRRADRQGFWGLSREGWCLRFLSQIAKSRQILAKSDPAVQELDVGPQHQNFDRELEESRCSPATELHLMQERISGRVAPPRPVERTRNSPNFDTGGIGETIHLGSYVPAARLGAAVNILRLCELSGVPPSVGNVGFFRATVSDALLWIREEYPGLWAAFVLRFRGIGIDEYREPGNNRKQDAIRRAILDVLPVEHIKRLYDAAMRELRRVVDAADGHGPFSGDTDRYEANQTIRRLGDAATRFSMCLGDQDREEVFVLFLRVSRSEALSQYVILQDTLWNMAWRTVSYFSTDMVNKWATEIFIQFPLVSVETPRRRRRLEISSFVLTSGDAKFVRPTSTEFDQGVARFIELLSSRNLVDRTGAAWRLLGMYDRGLLSETECDAFRKGLWNDLDEDGLPKVSPEVLRIIVHLQWPVEDETKVLEGLVSWILSQAVSDRFTPRESQDGGGAIQYSVTFPDQEDYLSGLHDLSYRLTSKSDAFGRVFAQPVRADILAKILEWWERERDRFLRQSEKSLFFGGDVFQRVEVTLQVLFDCVLGSGVADEKMEVGLKAFLEDLRGINQDGVYWFQVAAYLGVVAAEEYWAKVRADLWGNDSYSAYKALVSCSQWIRKRKSLDLEPIPGDVFVIIMSEIGNVRGERCRQVCELITQLVELGYVHGEDFDKALLRMAVNSAAVQLNYEAVEGAPSLVAAEFREMFPHLRRELTRLLVAMKQQGVLLDEIGEKWLKRAKADRFVDVRFVADDREA